MNEPLEESGDPVGDEVRDHGSDQFGENLNDPSDEALEEAFHLLADSLGGGYLDLSRPGLSGPRVDVLLGLRVAHLSKLSDPRNTRADRPRRSEHTPEAACPELSHRGEEAPELRGEALQARPEGLLEEALRLSSLLLDDPPLLFESLPSGFRERLHVLAHRVERALRLRGGESEAIGLGGELVHLGDRLADLLAEGVRLPPLSRDLKGGLPCCRAGLLHLLGELRDFLRSLRRLLVRFGLDRHLSRALSRCDQSFPIPTGRGPRRPHPLGELSEKGVELLDIRQRLLRDELPELLLEVLEHLLGRALLGLAGRCGRRGLVRLEDSFALEELPMSVSPALREALRGFHGALVRLCRLELLELLADLVECPSDPAHLQRRVEERPHRLLGAVHRSREVVDPLPSLIEISREFLREFAFALEFPEDVGRLLEFEEGQPDLSDHE